MDVILRCAFGIQADSQNNPDEPAINAAKRVINGSASRRTLVFLLGLMPFGNKIMEAFPGIITPNFDELLDISEGIVSAKKSAGSSAATKVVFVMFALSRNHDLFNFAFCRGGRIQGFQ